VNDWVKDISKSLEQVVKKNPGKSLEKILQEQGKTRTQIDEFLNAVRNAQYRARSMEGAGVRAQTLERIEELMKILRIEPWNY
jgi:copper homeostasis protein CutC